MSDLIISIVSATISATSASAAIASYVLAKKALDASQSNFSKNTELTQNIFKRQGVISLYTAWQDVNGIDANAVVTPHVVRAVNTIGLTAALWNHDVVDKEILFQQYWENFRGLFEVLDEITSVIPGLSKSGKGMLTPDIRRAYDEMRQRELDAVKVSSVQARS